MSRARELSKLGNLNVLAADDVNNEVGIASTVPRSTLDVRGELQVGTGIQVGPAGVITATSFDGALGGNIVAAACTFTTGTFNGNVTIGGTLTYEDVTNVDALGIVTARAGVNVSGGELKVGSAVTVSGVGVATFVGAAGVAVTITPSTGKVQATTFEGPLTGNVTGDITGDITGAVTGTTGSFSSNLTVGSGITFGSAGVATFSGTADIHLHDSVQLKIGDSSDLALYHNASGNSWMYNGTNGGDLYIGANAGEIFLQTGASANDTAIKIVSDGMVELRHDNNWKLQTTNDGIYVNGIGTATRSYINSPTTSVNENIPLLVKGILREEPAIGIQGPNANGYTWISDAYVDGEAQSSLGLSYSSSSFVIGQRVGVSTTTDNTYVSLTDAFAYRPSAIVLGHDGDIHFRNDNTNGVRPVGTAVTLTDRMVIKGDGDVGIGTDDPALKLHLHSESSNATFAHFTNTTTGVSGSDGVSIGLDSDENVAIYNYESSAIRFATGGSEKARFDSSGRLMVGTTGTTIAGLNAYLQVEGLSGETGSISVTRNSNDGGGPYLMLAKSRGTSDNSENIVSDGDRVGTILFNPADGSDKSHTTASIAVEIDDTPGANDIPGRIIFNTTNNGQATVTERLRIDSRGSFVFSNGALLEKVNITAGKLSDNTNIDLVDGMVHYFTTQESTTSTPNIRVSSAVTLNDIMTAGDVITVTLVTTAAAGGYSANMTIDGSAITEEWVGGEAPSAGGDDGLDIYVYTIICIHASNTGDSGFKVIANKVNATN